MAGPELFANNLSLTLTAALPAAALAGPTATLQQNITGGTLASGLAVAYRVVSRTAAGGRSLPGPEVTGTTGAGVNVNSETINWTAVPGADGGYDIFGRTAGAELLIGSVAAGTTTFTDTGSVTPSGALPTVDTTATTAAVTSTASLPALGVAGQLRVRRDTSASLTTAPYAGLSGPEIALVTATIDGTHVTVQRAQEGSTAVAWASGDVLTHVLTTKGLQALLPRSAAWNLKTDFGAKGDGRYVSDAVTNGTTTVTSATAAFTAGDVGKTVAVYSSTGAQVALTTVASVTNATTLVLAAAATNTASGQLLVIGTDDTAAVQAAFDAMTTAGGGACYVPLGLYVIAGPQKTATVGTQTYTGQVLVAGRDVAQGMAPLELFGDVDLGGITPPEAVSALPGSMPAAFFSTAMTGCMLSGRGTANNDSFAAAYSATARWSAWYLKVRNLGFRAALDPGVTMLNGRTFGCADFSGLAFDVLANPVAVSTSAFSRGGYGVTMPSQFNQTKSGLHRTSIMGYATGLEHSEHFYADEVSIDLCSVGIAFADSPNGVHGATYGRVIVQQCAVILQNRASTVTSNPLSALSGFLYVETGGTNNSPANIVYVDDPMNYFRGELSVSATNFASGSVQDQITVKGATNLRFRNLRTGSSAVAAVTAATPNGLPYTAPGQVTGLTAAPGNAQVTLSWSAPNTYPVPTDYLVQYRTPNGSGAYTTFTHAAQTATGITVTGLTNGSAYGFTVAAVNAYGTGAFSTEATATPTASVTTYLSENGTHPNGTLAGLAPQTGSGTWVAKTMAAGGSGSTSMQILSNQIVQAAYVANDNSQDGYNLGTLSGYTVVEGIVLGTTATRINIGMTVGGTSVAATGFSIAVDSTAGAVTLYRNVAGASGATGPAQTLVAGSSHTIKAVVTATTITVFYDGTQQFVYTLTTTEQAAVGYYVGPVSYRNTTYDDGTSKVTSFVVTSA